MSPEQLSRFKRRVASLWLFSPERLWLLSIRLRSRRHWMLAFWLKQLNTFLYHNSLAPGATVSPDISLGHNGLGIVIGANTQIGKGVKLMHNVTVAGGRRERQPHAPTPAGPRSRVIIEDHVRIGANSVIVPPAGRTVTIGRAAKIGAGTVVTQDVPAGATVVGQAPRVILAEPAPTPEPGVLSDATGRLEGER
ncbi:MAG TPA: DapH/DapD/GlmU-related protein [Solirubrobacteraceae bacterium]|nr:DapH/DapD/GlmU-related protein [Solirubrobacteraceae bacterium]